MPLVGYCSILWTLVDFFPWITRGIPIGRPSPNLSYKFLLWVCRSACIRLAFQNLPCRKQKLQTCWLLKELQFSQHPVSDFHVGKCGIWKLFHSSSLPLKLFTLPWFFVSNLSESSSPKTPFSKFLFRILILKSPLNSSDYIIKTSSKFS